MRLLLYWTGRSLTLADSESVRRSVDLLIPVAKAWSTDEGVRLASLALQVHGGMGYVEDTGIAQRLRDARIGPIYEGTNGIQAIDLVMRKVLADDGRAMREHIARLCSWPAPDGRIRETLRQGVDALERATSWVLDVGDSESVLAGATAYLELAGVVTAGALLASQAERLGDDECIADALFFATHRVGPACGLLHAVVAGVDSLPEFAATRDQI